VRAIPRNPYRRNRCSTGRYLGDVTTCRRLYASFLNAVLREIARKRMRGGRTSTVSLVDCLTGDSAGYEPVRGSPHDLNQDAGQPSPIRTPRPTARLRRRKSAFGFHLFTQDSRPETEDPVHAGHRDLVPPRRVDPVAGRELPERAEVRGAGERR